MCAQGIGNKRMPKYSCPSPQKFETKFIRVNVEDGKMLLLLMRGSFEVDIAGDISSGVPQAI